MLREIKKIRQSENDAHKRWFSDAENDLITWQRDGEIYRFEYCFGKGDDEHSLIWSRDSGYRHFRVDDGEDRTMRHKMTPVLRVNGLVDFDRLRQQFHNVAMQIDPAVVEFVENHLAERQHH